MNMSWKGGFAAAMIAAAALATPATAQDPGETVTVYVEYSDLDLSTEQGRDTLHVRLRDAAKEVCGMDIRVTGSTLPTAEARACYYEKLQSFEREFASAPMTSTRI
ncbi:UrcA family protein [Aurantiacibacter sp. MUD61]|uniref:UrcA family protein n=1 Tax=Aurantiacibacter sp. MUD61 TaxID=3009083 RepID=UPI0022F007D0|nr:UrcA family protein [Aurantiacibacter sp. MUD61]